MLAVVLVGCGNSSSSASAAKSGQAAAQPPAGKAVAPGAPRPDGAEAPLPPLATESGLPDSLRAIIDRPFTGDLDEMRKRRMLRVGVMFNRTHYFVDHGTQRGLSYEYVKKFEETLNASSGKRLFGIHAVFLPMSQDALLPALTAGRVDLVAAPLTITPERQRLVDFSIPIRRNVNEIVVSAPGARAVTKAEDLSGLEVFVRRSSSYFDSVQALNGRLQADGHAPVTILEAPENLADDDLLEMVHASLIPRTVVDDYVAEFWQQIFGDLHLTRSAALRTGSDMAVAFRKGSPKLAAAIDAFVRGHGPGTVFGNVVTRRYLRSTDFAVRATTGAGRQRFLAQVGLFRKYGEQYHLDYLLMMAKGYQESRLNQGARSRLGAIGVMQVMPATGRAMNVGDITKLEPNIHAGVKYVRKLMDEYLGNEPLDELNKTLMTCASYNAGPSRIRQLRREAERRNLDPNVWFGQVERIAAERIGRETVTYVSNIYKYYVAYRLVADEEKRKSTGRSTLKGQRS
jgi:membrane-bound lytic murein transglycosylase MltF